jgi:N-acetylglucosaminyldiphosphoundecaprenol N-acetyl-beta-D-mannosaminyltransferase
MRHANYLTPLPRHGNTLLPAGPLAPMSSRRHRRRQATSGAKLRAEKSRVQLGDLHLDNVTEQEAIGLMMQSLDRRAGGVLVNPNLNVARMCATTVDPGIINRAALCVVDGAPLVWAARIQGTPFVARIAGSNLLWHLCEAAERVHRTVFLLGGLPGAAEKATSELIRRFPDLDVVGYECPPQGFERDQDYMAALESTLRDARPDFVFVGLGFPKQEIVSQRLSRALPATWFVCGGASLDFAAGLKSRAPAWVQRIGFEWLYRAVSEPRRLGPRYAADARYGLTLLHEILRSRDSGHRGPRGIRGPTGIRVLGSHTTRGTAGRKKEAGR